MMICLSLPKVSSNEKVQNSAHNYIIEINNLNYKMLYSIMWKVHGADQLWK